MKFSSISMSPSPRKIQSINSRYTAQKTSSGLKTGSGIRDMKDFQGLQAVIDLQEEQKRYHKLLQQGMKVEREISQRNFNKSQSYRKHLVPKRMSKKLLMLTIQNHEKRLFDSCERQLKIKNIPKISPLFLKKNLTFAEKQSNLAVSLSQRNKVAFKKPKIKMWSHRNENMQSRNSHNTDFKTSPYNTFEHSKIQSGKRTGSIIQEAMALESMFSMPYQRSQVDLLDTGNGLQFDTI